LSDVPFDPERAARLQAENETLRRECALLREEASRIGTLTRALQARLTIVEADRDRLATYAHAIERSRPWRVVQALRGWIGRRW
jgi:hypothetical protein